jgi:hypothetical protein
MSQAVTVAARNSVCARSLAGRDSRASMRAASAASTTRIPACRRTAGNTLSAASHAKRAGGVRCIQCRSIPIGPTTHTPANAVRLAWSLNANTRGSRAAYRRMRSEHTSCAFFATHTSAPHNARHADPIRDLSPWTRRTACSHTLAVDNGHVGKPRERADLQHSHPRCTSHLATHVCGVCAQHTRASTRG